MLLHSLITTGCIATFVAIAMYFNGLNPVTGDFFGSISLRCAVVLAIFHTIYALFHRRALATWFTVIITSVALTAWWACEVGTGRYRITMPPWVVLLNEALLSLILTKLLSLLDEFTFRVFGKTKTLNCNNN